MKKLLYLFILIFGFLSCNSDDEIKIDNSDLIGKWNWSNTDGGIGYHIHETPISTGKNILLILILDNSYIITENGNEISNGTYEISMRESLYTGEMKRYIAYSKNYENQNTVISGLIRILENNTLIIYDNNVDGVESKYEKFN